MMSNLNIKIGTDISFHWPDLFAWSFKRLVSILQVKGVVLVLGPQVHTSEWRFTSQHPVWWGMAMFMLASSHLLSPGWGFENFYQIIHAKAVSTKLNKMLGCYLIFPNLHSELVIKFGIIWSKVQVIKLSKWWWCLRKHSTIFF